MSGDLYLDARAPVDSEGFGPIVSLWHVASALRDELRAWLPEYLSAFERQQGIAVGTTARIRSFEVRHAGIVTEGDQVPAVVVWLAGAPEEDRVYHPDGHITGALELGVRVLGGARDVASTGEVLHRYVAAVRALLFDRRDLRGHAAGLELIDEDYTGVEPGRERTTLACDFSYVATGVLLGSLGAGPGRNAVPRPDPSMPLEPEPISEHVVEHLTITPQPIYDPND